MDLPMTPMELLRLTMHETYPGHHTERVMKGGPVVDPLATGDRP